MSVVTLFEESRDKKALDGTSFYVPYFEVKIEGVGLPRDVLRDVTQLTYKDEIRKFDSFELTVNNWDVTTQSFKYVGSETAETLERDSRESRRFRLFEPCRKEVQVSMGYVGDLRLMMKGTFTAMEPNFPSGGGPTLTVRGLNVLHQLRRKRYTQRWSDKKDSEIAERLSELRDEGRRRFPYEVAIDTNARNREPRLTTVSQQNKFDIDFLLDRAFERGYVIYVRDTDRKLYFGPSNGGSGEPPRHRDVTFKLVWGKSLIDFKPNLSTANKVRKVRVRGFNRTTRRRIDESADIDSLQINRDLYRLLSCDEREEQIVNEPVFNEHQARERAKALLAENLKRLVTCTGTTVGLPDLRAGQFVHICGVGSRFSGRYFVTDTTHTIGESGYTTRFNARRENEGEGSSCP
jgi:phage protein D